MKMEGNRDEDSVDGDSILKDRGCRVLCLRLETKRDKMKEEREGNEKKVSEGGGLGEGTG